MSRRLLLVLSAVVATASESGVAETGSPTALDVAETGSPTALDVSEAGSPTGAVAETGSPTGAHAPGTVEAVYEEAADDADAAERVLVAAATAMPPNAEAKRAAARRKNLLSAARDGARLRGSRGRRLHAARAPRCARGATRLV